MSVRKEIQEYDGIYFITTTCARYISLFETVNGYGLVYKWFDTLKKAGHYITGYVIMPNHLHALIAFSNTMGQSINSIIGNGKRFMSYELVRKLKEQNKNVILNQLACFVNKTERKRGKLHEVFEPSFDWQECRSDKFIKQKLDYIHDNPCRGKWDLAQEPSQYPHSSAKFYLTGEQGEYGVMDYAMLDDIDLTKPSR